MSSTPSVRAHLYPRPTFAALRHASGNELFLVDTSEFITYHGKAIQTISLVHV